MLSVMDTFITRVKEEMARLGLNQTELAERCGTKQPAISRLLRGKEEKIDLRRCEAIAKALEVPLVSLLVQGRENLTSTS